MPPSSNLKMMRTGFKHFGCLAKRTISDRSDYLHVASRALCAKSTGDAASRMSDPSVSAGDVTSLSPGGTSGD